MTEVTRGEFDMLRQLVLANQGRLEAIDDHGTRGIAALTAQVAEIVKDVAALQFDLGTRFDNHARQHAQDRADRISGRRWMIGIGLGGIGTMGTVIGFLAALARAVHG